MNVYEKVITRLYKQLPAIIRNKLYRTVQNQVRQDDERKLKEIDAALPQIELMAEHIRNLTVVTDKTAILDVLPKHAIVAEIGVSKGKYSEQILSVTQPKKLYLIDSWTKEKFKGRDLIVKKRFEKEINAGNVFIREGFSTTELERFDDEYFDWVYIDTDHSYDTTSQELEICQNKVKRGGIIAGHDYTIGAWASRARYGVIEAVNQLCFKADF